MTVAYKSREDLQECKPIECFLPQRGDSGRTVMVPALAWQPRDAPWLCLPLLALALCEVWLVSGALLLDSALLPN